MLQECQICLISTITALIHSNTFIGRWYMMHFMYMMYSVYMQQCFLCIASLNSTELQESQISLIPTTTAIIHLNMFIGHWDMIYFVYIHQDSSCRAQSNAWELQESQDLAALNLRLCRYGSYLQVKPSIIQIHSLVVEIWHISCIWWNLCICSSDSCVELN